MERRLALALACAGAGVLSWATYPLRAGEGILMHTLQNATWLLIVGAVAFAVLASDGFGLAPRRGARKALVTLGVAAAALRAVALFLF
ncbi:MAG TPA: hypothetical protein VM582_04110 [Candidatus Thermoplasmatota archaeon]|nr:hypothetical protein [Candidatus Thermoplasmatota archaeon]